MKPTTVYEACDSADGWWVAAAVDGLDMDGVSMCQQDGQYMVLKGDKAYPTCVAYGNPGDACTNGELICPENPGNPGPGFFGWSGNHRSALSAAFSRNNYMHPLCPSSDCKTMDVLADSGSYWKDQILNNPYTSVTEAEVDNLCVDSEGQLMFVSESGYYATCVGWSKDPAEQCNAGEYLCSGHSGDGLFTYGWPGQIARTAAVALANSAGNYMHPQCPVSMCSA